MAAMARRPGRDCSSAGAQACGLSPAAAGGGTLAPKGRLMEEIDPEVSRRRFLRLAGGLTGAALTVSLGVACAPSAPTGTAAGPTAPPVGPTVAPAAPTGPTAAPTGGGTANNAVYPTYAAIASGPKADVPAGGAGYDDGFDKFPTNPTRAMPGDPPGTGSTVN